MRLEEEHVLSKYGAVEHWAKMEVDMVNADALQQRMQQKYPIAEFNRYRKQLDPKNIMANDIIERIFPSQADAV